VTADSATICEIADAPRSASAMARSLKK